MGTCSLHESLHTGIPAAFGLTFLGKSLTFLRLQFNTSGPPIISPSCGCSLCRNMPWIVQSHGEGLGGTLQALGLLLHPK